jgi:hypothetical protein
MIDVPSVFCVGGVSHRRGAGRHLRHGDRKCREDTVTVPSLTGIWMPDVVPASLAAGVPSLPVVVLKWPTTACSGC